MLHRFSMAMRRTEGNLAKKQVSSSAVLHLSTPMERSMRAWIGTWKRPLMGWVALGGLAAAILIQGDDLQLRFIVLVISMALLCIAIPGRVWGSFRDWFVN